MSATEAAKAEGTEADATEETSAKTSAEAAAEWRKSMEDGAQVCPRKAVQK